MAHDDIIPSDDFPHDHTDEIVCPYCGYEFTDSWEFNDTQDEQHVECCDCGKEFLLYVIMSVDYTTRKKKE
jgi:DNA-directed RNA polymerase subunit RPC12/RpoP